MATFEFAASPQFFPNALSEVPADYVKLRPVLQSLLNSMPAVQPGTTVRCDVDIDTTVTLTNTSPTTRTQDGWRVSVQLVCLPLTQTNAAGFGAPPAVAPVVPPHSGPNA